MASAHPYFAVQLVERRLALGRGLPGVGPEAQVDRPPVVADLLLGQRGHQRVEVELALAERRVGAGLVAAVGGLVAAVVAVDQVDVVDPAREPRDQLELAARQRLLLALLPGADHRHHLRRGRCRRGRRNCRAAACPARAGCRRAC